MIKKILIIAIVVLTGAYANAQTFIYGNSGGDLSFSGGGVSLNANFGVGDWTLIGPLGGRAEIQMGVSGGNFGLAFSADALFSLQHAKANNIGIYAGPGLALRVTPSTLFNIHGVVGIEYILNPKLSFIAEFIPALYFGSGIDFGGDIRFGLIAYI